MKNKINLNEIKKGLLFFLLTFIVPIIGYVFKKRAQTIWAVLFVLQIGIASLWWISKTGIFKITNKNFKNINNDVKKWQTKKHGFYTYEKKEIKIKKIKTINKNISGIIVMYLIALVELTIFLIIRFV